MLLMRSLFRECFYFPFVYVCTPEFHFEDFVNLAPYRQRITIHQLPLSRNCFSWFCDFYWINCIKMPCFIVKTKSRYSLNWNYIAPVLWFGTIRGNISGHNFRRKKCFFLGILLFDFSLGFLTFTSLFWIFPRVFTFSSAFWSFP